jgi:ppGpp synthetase/RelA/SpoT-type nucleotidyltranferase
MLSDFREAYDGALFSTSERLVSSLSASFHENLISGRSKRTKSIIRKLARHENRGMDLSRMVDIVGLRIIVPSLQTQNEVLETVKSNLTISDHRDYRSEKEYRAIHVIAMEDGKCVEIQVRTCAQQLWAEESESFGEQVKEGGGPVAVRQYLTNLSEACRALDNESAIAEEEFADELMTGRTPLTGKYPKLIKLFKAAVRQDTGERATNSHIVVYDLETNQLLRDDEFRTVERAEAVREYRRLSASLPADRFDVVLLSSTSTEALSVTHARLFPYA